MQHTAAHTLPALLQPPLACQVLFCRNEACPGKASRQLKRFADECVEGLGPSMIKQLMAEGLANDAADLFYLSMVGNRSITVPGAKWQVSENNLPRAR